MTGDRAPLEVETALYRIAQEALHNVVKHAEANTVIDPAGRLARRPGSGSRSRTTAAGSIPRSSRPATWASPGMRARASQIGATIEVTSGAGCRHPHRGRRAPRSAGGRGWLSPSYVM